MISQNKLRIDQPIKFSYRFSKSFNINHLIAQL